MYVCVSSQYIAASILDYAQTGAIPWSLEISSGEEDDMVPLGSRLDTVVKRGCSTLADVSTTVYHFSVFFLHNQF